MPRRPLATLGAELLVRVAVVGVGVGAGGQARVFVLVQAGVGGVACVARGVAWRSTGAVLRTTLPASAFASVPFEHAPSGQR